MGGPPQQEWGPLVCSRIANEVSAAAAAVSLCRCLRGSSPSWRRQYFSRPLMRCSSRNISAAAAAAAAAAVAAAAVAAAAAAVACAVGDAGYYVAPGRAAAAVAAVYSRE